MGHAEVGRGGGTEGITCISRVGSLHRWEGTSSCVMCCVRFLMGATRLCPAPTCCMPAKWIPMLCWTQQLKQGSMPTMAQLQSILPHSLAVSWRVS